MKPIFHIAKQSDWQQAQKEGVYSHSTLHKTLADEGFIHCSDSNQVMHIANLIYKNEDDLLLLCIDTQKLSSPVKYENTSGGTGLYPHIYGVLNVSAVYATAPLTKNDKDEFVAPNELLEAQHMKDFGDVVRAMVNTPPISNEELTKRNKKR